MVGGTGDADEGDDGRRERMKKEVVGVLVRDKEVKVE